MPNENQFFIPTQQTQQPDPTSTLQTAMSLKGLDGGAPMQQDVAQPGLMPMSSPDLNAAPNQNAPLTDLQQPEAQQSPQTFQDPAFLAGVHGIAKTFMG